MGQMKMEGQMVVPRRWLLFEGVVVVEWLCQRKLVASYKLLPAPELAVPAFADLWCGTEELYLDSMGLHDSGVMALCHAIHIAGKRAGQRTGHPVTLRKLILSNNDIGKAGGIEIARMLATNKTIVELDISWNRIEETAAYALFRVLRNANTTLRVLHAQWNNFGRNGTYDKTLFATLLTSAGGCLEVMNLNSNGFAEDSVFAEQRDVLNAEARKREELRNKAKNNRHVAADKDRPKKKKQNHGDLADLNIDDGIEKISKKEAERRKELGITGDKDVDAALFYINPSDMSDIFGTEYGDSMAALRDTRMLFAHYLPSLSAIFTYYAKIGRRELEDGEVDENADEYWTYTAWTSFVSDAHVKTKQIPKSAIDQVFARITGQVSNDITDDDAKQKTTRPTAQRNVSKPNIKLGASTNVSVPTDFEIRLDQVCEALVRFAHLRRSSKATRIAYAVAKLLEDKPAILDRCGKPTEKRSESATLSTPNMSEQESVLSEDVEDDDHKKSPLKRGPQERMTSQTFPRPELYREHDRLTVKQGAKAQGISVASLLMVAKKVAKRSKKSPKKSQGSPRNGALNPDVIDGFKDLGSPRGWDVESDADDMTPRMFSPSDEVWTPSMVIKEAPDGFPNDNRSFVPLLEATLGSDQPTMNFGSDGNAFRALDRETSPLGKSRFVLVPKPPAPPLQQPPAIRFQRNR